ncbi:protein of unknown function [Catalinimonas alkaloidigena]|uniref:DUF4271 domain-containing protein n=1 Tax=Catalinimonas alkaloidigena TaxID=1075417 RepID=A0A1G9MNW9_9BACT|nr:DUF4271 domain-containing protein [Catalinimonas alkaloidigena]SDL75607.1 protein of unknown function [Catalinimonas alkaloidigena]
MKKYVVWSGWKLVGLSCIILGMWSGQGLAQTPAVVVQELEDRWLYFDEEYEAYVPWLGAAEQPTHTLSLELKADSLQPYQLRFVTTPELCLFVNQQLYKCYDRTDTLTVPLANLAKQFATSQLFLTFYHPQRVAGAIKAPQLILPKQAVAPPALETSEGPVLSFARRPVDRSFQDTLMLSLLVLCSLYVVAKNSAPRTFGAFLNFRKLFTASVYDYTPSSQRTWSGVIPLLILINSVAIGFILLSLQRFIPFQLADIPFFEGDYTLTGRFVRLSLIALFYYVFIYLTIHLLGWLFSIRQAADVHFYEFTRFTTLMCLLMILLILGDMQAHFLGQKFFVIGLAATALGFTLLRIIKMVVVLNKSLPYKKVYIFSYLCATEFIPFFVVIKYLQVYTK